MSCVRCWPWLPCRYGLFHRRVLFKSDVFVYADIVANARADIDTISGTIDCLTKWVAIELSLALSHDFANIGATSRTDACADVCINETDGEAFAFPTGSTDNIDIQL